MGNPTINDILKVIARRTDPGILIFDLRDKLVYLNPEAHTILSAFTRSTRSKQSRRLIIPREVQRLCNRLKQGVKKAGEDRMNGTASLITMHQSPSVTYALKGMVLHEPQQAKNRVAGFLMVIMERFSHQRGMNLDKAKELFHLSRREVEVTRLVLGACPNKEIAAKLNVSEYTIKDHLKHIMKKAEVTTRAQIMFKILQS